MSEIDYLDDSGSELVIAIVGALGVDHKKVIETLKSRFEYYNYETAVTKISTEVIPKLSKKTVPTDRFERAKLLIDEGDELRKKFDDNSILALGALNEIYLKRVKEDELVKKKDEDGFDSVRLKRKVRIISSLKRPEEVDCLRRVYPRGVYLVGIYSDPKNREARLVEENGGMEKTQAAELIKRDEKEKGKYGQRTRDTFHLADFFVEEDDRNKSFKSQINRIVDLIFGKPFETPTFDEYAMFQAFSASLRSADLSRQVGAAISVNRDIVAIGANDCPKPEGGLFWREVDSETGEYYDEEGGRDYTTGKDMNTCVRNELFNGVADSLSSEGVSRKDVITVLESSGFKDITEYGRMVHAEMEALLSCSRNSISCRNGILYATTFPCHNCAKHIIAAGIKEIVYVEPYPKSKTLEFYSKDEAYEDKILFRPFIGVGPRQFFNLFSMNLSAGGSIKRKDSSGSNVSFSHHKATPRIAIRPFTYIHIEETIAEAFKKHTENEQNSTPENST